MNQVKMYRLKQKITQLQLAKELNINQATISMWEREKSNPTAKLLPKLAKILNCTIDELFLKKEVL